MLYTLILLSAVGALRFAASFHFTHAFRIPRISTSLLMSEEVAVEEGKQEVEITSKEIVRLQRKIEELTANINATVAMKHEVNEEYKRMDEEYGSEIQRVKKEFARMKERSIEEATNEANAARANALKEILPMADNYARAKAIYQPTSSEKQDQILGVYDEVFAKFASVIEGFGLERVQALGQPFDYNFMEAVMSMPSTEYKEGIVSVEYQVGYKMGDKSIRPAMVVVSTGPGPA